MEREGDAQQTRDHAVEERGPVRIKGGRLRASGASDCQVAECQHHWASCSSLARCAATIVGVTRRNHAWDLLSQQSCTMCELGFEWRFRRLRLGEEIQQLVALDGAAQVKDDLDHDDHVVEERDRPHRLDRAGARAATNRGGSGRA